MRFNVIKQRLNLLHNDFIDEDHDVAALGHRHFDDISHVV